MKGGALVLSYAGALSVLAVIFWLLNFMRNGSVNKIGGCFMILTLIGVLLFAGFVTLLLTFGL